MRRLVFWALMSSTALLALAGCVGQSPRQSNTGNALAGGGYYQQDGPLSLEGVALDGIPDAVPRAEPLHRASTKPYQALGRQFVPMTSREPYQERGEISWYGKQYHGRDTSMGEKYDAMGMSAAHPTLPLPSFVRVTNLDNGKQVVLRVNDRGPFLHGRILDVSYVAAAKLGFIQRGSARAEVTAVFPDDKEGENITVYKQPSPVFIKSQPSASLMETPEVPLLADTANLIAQSSTAWLAPSQVSSGELIQVGAFSKPDAATTWQKSLRGLRREDGQALIPDSVKWLQIRDKTTYKLWIVGFPAGRNATEFSRELNAHGVSHFVVNHRQP